MLSYARKKWARVTLDFVLFLSIFWAPFWLTSILALIFIFLFKNYYEFLIVFFLSFIIYTENISFMNVSALYIFVPIIFFFTTEYLKKRLFL